MEVAAAEAQAAEEHCYFAQATTLLQVVRNPEGELLTEPFLSVCRLVIPVLVKMGPAFALVKNDITNNIDRLNRRRMEDPGSYSQLYVIITREVEADDHNHSQSCTKGLLWLKRAMEFNVAILTRLLEDPDASMSTIVSETYAETLSQWHGFIVYNMFTLAFNLVPSRMDFIASLGADPDHVASGIKAFVAAFSPVLAEVHQFLSSHGLDDPAKV